MGVFKSPSERRGCLLTGAVSMVPAGPVLRRLLIGSEPLSSLLRERAHPVTQRRSFLRREVTRQYGLLCKQQEN